MTAVSSLVDLDDSDALIAADREGSLRSAALAGAQVRAVATAVDESVLERLADLRPRSVVIVTGDGRSSRAASLLVAALGDRLGVPWSEAPEPRRGSALSTWWWWRATTPGIRDWPSRWTRQPGVGPKSSWSPRRRGLCAPSGEPESCGFRRESQFVTTML